MMFAQFRIELDIVQLQNLIVQKDASMKFILC